jgi:hypothetical protein
VVPAAFAGTNTYQNSSAPAGTWSTSGIFNITGGEIDSGCGGLPTCQVWIRTTLYWSPYYVLVQGHSYSSHTEISHGTQTYTRSRCMHWWDGAAGSETKTCSLDY